MQLNTLYTATALWTSDRLVVETSSKQHVQDTKHIRPWRDSNPQSQRPQTHSKGKRTHIIIIIVIIIIIITDVTKRVCFYKNGGETHFLANLFFF